MNATADTRLGVTVSCWLTGLCLLWGLNSVAIKWSNAGIDPIFGAGVRSMIATVCLVAWMKIGRHRLFAGRVADGMLVGGLFGIEFGLLYCAMVHTTAASAFLLLYSTPFFHALGAHFFLKNDRLNAVKMMGLLLAFAGIFVLLSKHLGTPSLRHLFGDVLAIAAAMVWAATTIYVKRRLVGHVSAQHTLFYQILFSIPVLLILSALFGEAPVRSLDAQVVTAMVYQGMVVAFGSYLVWFHLVHRHPVSRLSAFTFLTPLFAALAGTLLLKEPVTMQLVIALVLVSCGIYVINRQP